MLRLLKRLEIQFVIECFDVNRSWKVPMVEKNYGGKLYSPSDEVETIAGHVFKSPKPPRAQHGKRQCQQQSTAAITGGSGVGIDGNGIQRQSSFLLKRLDAKKSMAEISIPVRIGVFLLYVETFFSYLLIHGFPIWVVSISIDAFFHYLRFPLAGSYCSVFLYQGNASRVWTSLVDDSSNHLDFHSYHVLQHMCYSGKVRSIPSCNFMVSNTLEMSFLLE